MGIDFAGVVERVPAAEREVHIGGPRRWYRVGPRFHAAKTNLSKLIERAEAGAEISIARGDQPAVKLIAVKVAPKRQFGLYKGLAKIGPEFFEPVPEEELRAWEGQ